MAPAPVALRHVALRVADVARAEAFYVGALALRVAWRPDPDNVYLTSGSDSLALHRVPEPPKDGALDHLGFFVARREDVDEWARHLAEKGHAPKEPPRDHRDGTRSFYVRDPDGNVVQVLHHPDAAG